MRDPDLDHLLQQLHHQIDVEVLDPDRSRGRFPPILGADRKRLVRLGETEPTPLDRVIRPEGLVQAVRDESRSRREALQIRGGMGYAEEYPVSRLFVDARVLSIFEGADETLCLKVIARRLVDTAA